jgi:hypothetical protein
LEALVRQERDHVVEGRLVRVLEERQEEVPEDGLGHGVGAPNLLDGPDDPGYLHVPALRVEGHERVERDRVVLGAEEHGLPAGRF